MTTITTTRGAEGLARRAFSVGDVRRMLEAGVLGWGERFELIRGEIVPMASEMSRHAQMKARLARWFAAQLDASWDVGSDISVSLGPIGLFDADVLVWRPISERDFIPISAAAFAAEVADTTLSTDLRLKAPDYAAAGLPELWIVDLNGRRTHVFRAPRDGAWSEAFEVP